MIRVLIVDDEPSVRQGLRMRLARDTQIEMVGEADDGETAVSDAIALRPDVVVMDVELTGLDGITAANHIHSAAPHCAIVVLSIHDDALTRARVHAAGIDAFVSKHDSPATLLAAIHTAAERPPPRPSPAACAGEGAEGCHLFVNSTFNPPEGNFA